jgi:hypothetical protein
VVKKIRTSRQRLDSAVGDNAERREVLQEESAIGEAFKLIAETKTAMTQMHAEQQVREDNEIAIEAHQPTDKYSRKKQRAKALTELNMEDHEIITRVSAGMRITQTTKEILAFAEKKKQQNIREKKQNKKLKPRTGYRQQRQTLTRNTTSRRSRRWGTEWNRYIRQRSYYRAWTEQLKWPSRKTDTTDYYMASELKEQGTRQNS